MPVSAYNKFQQFTEDLVKGVHDFDAHVFKVMLTNVAPVATNAVKADITEIAPGNGYTAGGNTLAFTSSEHTAGTTNAIFADNTFTATGAFATFRYAVVYNDTPVAPADPLICWFDYGSAISMANLETFVLDLDGIAGLFSIT